MAFSVPDELVMEIMSRVRGKSVVRFRSVSKQFRSLLSDPFFLQLHHNRSRDSLFTLKKSNIVYNKTHDFSVTNKVNGLVHDFKLDFDTPIARTLGSYHQLLCFVCRTGIYLCNPMNKESKKLSSRLCFNESDQCLVSFGFVEATKQYKVVKWPHNLDENRRRKLPSGLITTWKRIGLKFEVCTIDIVEDGRLKVSGWTRLERPCPYLLQLSSQVHVNGFIYWTTSDFEVVSFSLQDDTFSTLNPKPPCFRLDAQENHVFSLSGSRGNLWMTDCGVFSRIIEIWKMEENAWSKIHKIDIQELYPNKFPEVVEMIDIRLDQVLLLFNKWFEGFEACYDAKTNTIKQRQRQRHQKRYYEECHSTDGLLSLQNIF